MFQWIQSSSSKNIRRHISRRQQFSLNIKKGGSTIAFSSMTGLEASTNHDFKEYFVKKSFDVPAKTKQVSRRLMSMFQRKTKQISTNNKKNQSMDNLLNDSMEQLEDSFFGEDERKLIVDGNSSKKVSIVKQNEVLLKKKSPHNCDEKKVQVSDSNWEVTVNEGNSLTTSWLLIKIRKKTQVPSRVKNNEAIVRGRPMLTFSENSESSSMETPPCSDDKSSFFSDSAVCVTGNDCSSHEAVDKLRDLRINCSSDCAESCDKYKREERKRFGEVPMKIFSRSVLNKHEELYTEERGRYGSSVPLKSEESLVDEVGNSGKRNSRKFDQVKSSIKGHEQLRLIGENCSRIGRFLVSKSSDDSYNEDFTWSFDDRVPEFGSLNDFPCTRLRMDADENCDNVNNKDPEIVDENTEVQEVSLRCDYEDDEESDYFVDSCNGSYVTTMYV